MKKLPAFLISIAVFWGVVKLLQKPRAKLQVFTHREQEILNLIATGYMDNEIADLLHTSETIIEKHKSNILGKMKVHDVSSAIENALEKGLVNITYA